MHNAHKILFTGLLTFCVRQTPKIPPASRVSSRRRAHRTFLLQTTSDAIRWSLPGPLFTPCLSLLSFFTAHYTLFTWIVSTGLSVGTRTIINCWRQKTAEPIHSIKPAFRRQVSGNASTNIRGDKTLLWSPLSSWMTIAGFDGLWTCTSFSNDQSSPLESIIEFVVSHHAKRAWKEGLFSL